MINGDNNWLQQGINVIAAKVLNSSVLYQIKFVHQPKVMVSKTATTFILNRWR